MLNVTRAAFSILVFAFLIFVLTSQNAHAEETVAYSDGETALEGYWVDAQCADHETAPVIMIIHQWKGLGPHEKEAADRLSALCYNAFAVDMYGKDIRPETAQEAGAQAGKYKNDPALARQRATAALSFARTRMGREDVPVAVIGYCFGGTMVLELARSGVDILGAVSFHGGLSTKAPVTEPGIITASIQVHHGAADPNVPQAEVSAFMDEMNAAGADWSLTQYAGAVHAFTHKDAGDDPSKGVAYNKKADERSWAAMTDFLAEIFGRP